MTPYKNFSKETTWQNRIRRGGLYVAVSVALAAQIGCNSDNGTDWEQVTVYQPTKGVITTIEESANGAFEIIDEQMVETTAQSRVIIRKLNGNTDTLTLAQAKGMVQAQDTLGGNNAQSHVYHPNNHGIGRSLWWGTMGYLMGRNFSSPVQPAYYRNGNSSFMGGRNLAQELKSSSVPRTMMRPTNGRTGFFSGRGGGGYSG
jgi:hypothetical protein